MSWEALWYGPRDWRALAAAPALAPLSWLYAAGVAARNATFSLGLRRPVTIDGATVVSVGNLVVGGAGKTPVTIFLARWASACGRKVAVLSRGYGRSATRDVHFTSAALPAVEDVGDEPRLIARRCPGLEVFVGRGRAVLAQAARARGADFLVLDDGFQHRQLHRDVDLVVLSDLGNGHRLPWGPLREAPVALQRATVLWGADGAAARQPRVRARSVITGVVTSTGAVRAATELAGRDVFLLLGIARPQRVVRSLEALGARVVGVQAHPDHHHFTAAECTRARTAADAARALLVTTEKDRERLPDGFEALAPRLDVEPLEGVEVLARLLGLDPAAVPRAVTP